MENIVARRGIDLQNRLWDNIIGKRFKNGLNLDGGPIDRTTFLGLFIVLCFNFFIISSIFGKDLTYAFSSSYFLMSIGELIEKTRLIDKSQFFLVLSFLSLFFAPINIYLFIRRIALRHELTAFIATLFFVIPNPLITEGMPLLHALLNGDGAHMVTFSFIPLFLLHFKAFIRSGFLAWGFLASIISTIVAIISPFAFLSILVLFSVITVSEGFMGGFKIKFLRLFFVLICSFFLSSFWYHPGAIGTIMKLESIELVISYFWKVFPITIPIVPVVGAISFLVFDRREKLQPVFISIFVFVLYLLLFKISASFSIAGIFVPERYLIELSFSGSFLAAIIFGFFIELFFRKISDGSVKKLKRNHIFLIISIAFTIITIVSLKSVFKMMFLRSWVVSGDFVKYYTGGVGSIKREVFFSNFSSFIGLLITLATFIILFYALKYYPNHVVEIKKIKNNDT